jgi:hypothetical protein
MPARISGSSVKTFILSKMKSTALTLVSVISVFASVATSYSHEDVVTAWNSALLSAARATKMNPPAFSRAAAIVHVAIYDALNGIAKTHRPYYLAEAAPSGASVEAAVSAAAFAAASALFDNAGVRQTNFAVVHARALAAIPEGSAKVNGILWGESVANAIFAHRAGDGSSDETAYSAEVQAGIWRPTLPGNAAALLPHWGRVKPFSMTSGDQFRPFAPAPLNSSSYAMEVNVTRQIGGATSSARTADQTAIAQFWSDGGGTETPPGHWNHIAADVAHQRNLSLMERARLFALLNIALADSAIACWDSKYAFNLWRPITAIREAESDGNSETEADPNWLPLISTPPFPECTSGHSTFSRAAATVLAGFFGTDQISFSTGSDGLPGVTRSFTSFSQAAEEAGISRVYGGIHFPTANLNGQSCGYSIGKQVLSRFLQPAGSLHFSGVSRSGGNTDLTLKAEPDKSFVVRASHDLTTWEVIGTLLSSDGTIRFSDPNSVSGQLRFYEALELE